MFSECFCIKQYWVKKFRTTVFTECFVFSCLVIFFSFYSRLSCKRISTFKKKKLLFEIAAIFIVKFYKINIMKCIFFLKILLTYATRPKGDKWCDYKLLRQPQFLPLVKYQVWSFQIQKHNKESSIDPTQFLKITKSFVWTWFWSI